MTGLRSQGWFVETRIYPKQLNTGTAAVFHRCQLQNLIVYGTDSTKSEILGLVDMVASWGLVSVKVT